MFVSLLSVEFISFSLISIALVSSLRGVIRQGVFLTANLAFVYFVLGPIGFLSTVAFCSLGYGLAILHRARSSVNLVTTIPILVLLFIYMRNYEILGFVLPDQLLLSALRTVGLSFILFKMIHVLTDSKGDAIQEINFLTFINYCLNFTTFMMGPIQRYQDYYDQWNGLKESIPLTFEAHLDAVLRVLVGFVKIYIIGASLVGFALQSNTDVTQIPISGVILKLYAFYFFLYMNFSGYCDVMIGIGSLLGNRPPENFNKPYLAQNISDFWLRQHRSLTLWLTDYVFTPLFKWGLSHKTLSHHLLVSGNLAIFLTMLVSGIWHGTTLGFLFFGLTHGFFLIIYRTWDHYLTKRLGRKRVKHIRSTWPVRVLGMFLTFNAASFAFLFFQLDSPNLLILVNQVLNR